MEPGDGTPPSLTSPSLRPVSETDTASLAYSRLSFHSTGTDSSPSSDSLPSLFQHDTDDRTALDHDDSNKHFSLSEVRPPYLCKTASLPFFSCDTDSPLPTSPSQLGKTPVMFDYDEPGDSRPDHHADGGWHNVRFSISHFPFFPMTDRSFSSTRPSSQPMMYVDPEKDAPETYDSLPHWQWFDED